MTLFSIFTNSVLANRTREHLEAGINSRRKDIYVLIVMGLNKTKM